MKKFLVYSLVIALFSCFCFAEEGKALADKKMVLGLDAPTIGWVGKNDNGEITSLMGVNAGLGFSYRSYFSPVKANQFNGYWHAGTVLLLLPYVGVGADYVWENGFYAGIGTYYIIPEIHFGIMF